MKEIIKKIPSSEDVTGVICTTTSGKIYRITQSYANAHTVRFTLFEEVPQGFKRLGIESSPMPLYELIPWLK